MNLVLISKKIKIIIFVTITESRSGHFCPNIVAPPSCHLPAVTSRCGKPSAILPALQAKSMGTTRHICNQQQLLKISGGLHHLNSPEL